MHTDADFECQFRYQPEGWEKEYRFVGLRSDQPEPDAADPDQIGLFDGLACRYRVFVTNMDSWQWSPAEVVAFYNKRAAVENLIQEANNDIGLTAHLIAYHLNCWLARFEREESLTVPELTHRTVATNRLRLLYLAARITRHGGQTEIHFGAQYQERNRFDQLMARLRAIERSLNGFAPVIHTPLRA